jgi:glycosyltransferase involved in cell wall biosynthesis
MNKLLFIVNIDKFFVSHRLPIALEAIRQGYEVHVATKITDQLSLLESSGIIVHPLNLHRSGVVSIASEFFEILLLMYKISPKVVHLVTIKPVIFGGIAARILRLPAVVSAISGLGFVFISNGFVAKIRKKIVLYLYRISLNHDNQKIIFQNSDDRDMLISLAKIHCDKTILIPGSGVDLSKYKVLPLVRRNTPIVMFASRFLIDKGIKEFVSAAELISRKKKCADFVLVGDIDISNPASIRQYELDEWNKKGAVKVWGYSDHMEKSLSMATIVVLPSYREGFPKVLIEAAACGRVVVTTNVSGCRDAVKNGVTGLLVPVRDSISLANSISCLLDNYDYCVKMGINGRKMAEELFDIEKVVFKHMRIYSELFGKFS